MNSNKNNHFLSSSIDYFKSNKEKRISFVKKKSFLFSEISNFLNNCISDSKKIIFFCCGNSLISKYVNSDNKYIQEIDDSYNENLLENDVYNNLDHNYENIINEVDHIIIADIEHQKNPSKNLLQISQKINDDARIIVLSKSFFWFFLIKFLRNIFLQFSPKNYNFLPTNYLENLFNICNLEVVRTEKIIAFPIYIPFLTNVINKLFRLPLLNFFCINNLTILKKIKTEQKKINYQKVSVIIPCKNEEKNIPLFKGNLKNLGQETEYLFGNDKSEDKTVEEIKKLESINQSCKIILYEAPGVCKSENVYRGIEESTGDIIVIYDADLTVDFEDVALCLKIFAETNADFLNCTRMIYPQNNNAMKKANFFGNMTFAFLFSILFKSKITDTLCGTKIFYKKDWKKIKKDVSSWGMKDLWGDFDLLIGAYKNNLKLIEFPVTYYERKEGITKMTSVLKNGLRMLWIIVYSFYKLRLKN